MSRSDRSSGSFATRRTRGFALRRLVLAALTCGPLAVFSGAYSLAVTLDTSEPELAQRLYADLPLAKVKLGDRLIARAAGASGSTRKARRARESHVLAIRFSPENRALLEARALSSLGDTAYSTGALRQLALIESDIARRGQLLDLSRDVSRRDLAATAQLAEHRLQNGQLGKGLALIDEGLSLSQSLDTRIFPLLLEASGQGDFPKLMAPVLARDPVWAGRLARFATADSESAAQFVSLTAQLPRGSRTRSLEVGGPLVDTLAKGLRLEAAFDAYRLYSRAAQDPSAFGTRPLMPLDWQLIDGIDAGARLIGSGDARIAEIFAAARRSGPSAQIVTRLSPGSYALVLALSDTRGTGGALQLDRVCMIDGQELATATVAAPIDEQRVRLPFEVTRDCPYQSLRLGIEAGSESVSVLVRNVTLGRGDGAGR